MTYTYAQALAWEAANPIPEIVNRIVNPPFDFRAINQDEWNNGAGIVKERINIKLIDIKRQVNGMKPMNDTTKIILICNPRRGKRDPDLYYPRTRQEILDTDHAGWHLIMDDLGKPWRRGMTLGNLRRGYCGDHNVMKLLPEAAYRAV
ncbi:hypothetical protein BJ508DRAFT_313098 [Ascobolus immersus RN42]|uniref:Uncharacterized protein n=1 Tax=Ascobolus immersus RN42 TaxID=1160509 RepID=A0A3N4HK43_ASCIM|nr:hypothetical protein BJ508DRAFT_313098 [Ascobolus immersus RN42]